MSLQLSAGLPMDDALFDQRNEAIHDLPQHFHRLLLVDEGGHLHVLLEIAVAELLDDVVIIGALHHLVNGHDVFGLDLLEDLDLLKQRMLEVLVRVDCIRREVLNLLARTLMAQMRLVCSCSPLKTSP